MKHRSHPSAPHFAGARGRAGRGSLVVSNLLISRLCRLAPINLSCRQVLVEWHSHLCRRRHRLGLLGWLDSSKALIKLSEQASLPPKLPVADDVDDLLRAGDSHVQQVRPPASPATSAGLCRVWRTQYENHRLSFAALHRMYGADSLIDPAPDVPGNPAFKHPALATYAGLRLGVCWRARARSGAPAGGVVADAPARCAVAVTDAAMQVTARRRPVGRIGPGKRRSRPRLRSRSACAGALDSVRTRPLDHGSLDDAGDTAFKTTRVLAWGSD